MKALEDVQQYREIGTVKECRVAVEKQKQIKPEKEEIYRNGLDLYGSVYEEKANTYKCPVCDSFVGFVGENPYIYYCTNCGQAIDWSDINAAISL